jgi:hypothetical protein
VKKGRENVLQLLGAGKLIILSGSGILSIGRATPGGFRETARCDVLQGASGPRKFWNPPVLCNAKIYCRNLNGDLICVDVSK